MADKTKQNKKKKRRRTILLIILGAVVLLVVLNLLSSGEELPKVSVEEIEPRTIASIVDGTGNVRPAIEVDLSALMSGEITLVAVVEGQQVSEGDLILELDPDQSESLLSQSHAGYSSASASLDLAKANLSQAEEELRRSESLYRDGLISDQEWGQAQTSVEVLRAQSEAAQANTWSALASVRAARDSVDKTRYVSPMNGVVVALNVEEGEVAVPGTTNIGGTALATIASLEGMKVEADVDETDVIHLAIGQQAIIEIEAFPREQYAGHVSEIARSAKTTYAGTNEEVVNFEIKVVIDDELPAAVLPGMSATIEITTKTVEEAVAVPISAVVLRDAEQVLEWLGEDYALPDDRDDVEGVFVVRDGLASFHPITTGIADDTYIEVLSGLAFEDRVIAGPYKELRELADGDEIEELTENEGE